MTEPIVAPTSQKGAILVFDLETTGLPHQADKIVPVQIAGIFINPNAPGWPELSRFSSFIQIPADATLQAYAMGMHLKHGRKHGFFQLKGEPSVQVYENLAAMLTRYQEQFGRKVRFAGHNAATFDIPLLKRDAYRYGVDLDSSTDYHPIDTMIMADFKHGGLFGDGTMPKVSLRNVAKQLGFAFDEKAAHDAMYDVEATLFCLRKLAEVI